MSTSTLLLALIMLCQSFVQGRVINDNMQKDSSCGHFIPSSENIVGGRLANQGQVPWQLHVDFPEDECGATLVTPFHAITAAHCLEVNGTYTSCIGTYNTSCVLCGGLTDTVNEQCVFIKEAIMHPGYTGVESQNLDDMYHNDIAILKFENPLRFNDFVRPACLPTRDSILTSGDSLRVSGFGSTLESSEDGKLRLVDIPFHDDQECSRNMGKDDDDLYDGEKMFCAGFVKGGKDSCQGDSGGPAVKIENNRATLMGVVSFGSGCGEPHALGAYTEVTKYLDWIEKNIV